MYSGDDSMVSAAYDFNLTAQAEELAAKAMAGIEKTAPGWPKIHEKRQRRERRLTRLGDQSMIVAIIGQWLSAKQNASAIPDMRATIERVSRLADEVAQLQRQLAHASAALRYEATSEGKGDIAGSAYLAARSLAEALPALQFAREIAEDMSNLLPANVRGCSGIVGALRDAPPDEALAIALARYWIYCGLTYDGGNDGDDLDRFLDGILGEVTAKKALKKARNYLSRESSGPE